MSVRTGPGELTLAAVATLVVAGYALARAGQTGVFGAALVGMFALGLFVVGVVWPVVATRGIAIMVEGPRDAVVGDEIELAVRLSGRGGSVLLRPLDPAGEWHRAEIPSEGKVAHIATHRGVFRHVRFEVRSGAPLGVLARRLTLVAQLRAPVEVGPRPIPTRWEPQRLGGAAGEALSAVLPHAPDTVRSVRPYQPGDPARLMHWPTTARLGAPVVRELEPPSVVGVALIVDLASRSGAYDEAGHASIEDAVSRAAGLGLSVLAAGGRLLLITSERRGSVVGEVSSSVALSRRLARAVVGPVSAPPHGWPVEVVSP